MPGYRRYLTYAAIVVIVLIAGAVAGVAVAGRGAAGGRDTVSPGEGSQAGRGDGGNPFRSVGEYLRTRRGLVTAVTEDLRTGRTWTLGDGRPQPEASSVKLDILEALLARARNGLPAAQRALAGKMITVSDNNAATALWNAAGGAAGIGRYNRAAGLTGTRLSACVRCPGFRYPGWGLSVTTPADQVTLLRQLVAPGTPRARYDRLRSGAHRGPGVRGMPPGITLSGGRPPGSALLSAATRGDALSLLEKVTPTQRWGVSSGVPAGVTVALKNGWLPLRAGDWQVNSGGWVSGDGRDYLLVVLSTRDPSERYGIATVSHVGALVWSALR